MKTFLKIFIYVCIIGLLIFVFYNNRDLKALVNDVFENKSKTDFTIYLGKWFLSTKANDFESVFYEGGAILEIKEVKDNYIKGYYAEIQLPPANRIADFEFEGFIINNKITFDFVDGFLNKGNATIKFRNGIVVIINNIKISDSSAWQVHSGKYRFENKSR